MFYVWNKFGLDVMECFGMQGGAGFTVRYILRLSLILLDLYSSIKPPRKQTSDV
jgi:hypothetical protein